MSINSSIFAGVGRPQPIATAVRIPLSGPFNTLVVVHLRAASVIPGIMINNGRMERFHMSYPSSFILVGFDQRFPPDFRHSTAGFLSYIATGDDATITYAIDAISGHFDEIGRYWVDYEAAMLNDREVSAADCTLSSWVLVNEPRQDTRGLRRAWTASSTPNAQASRFSLPLEERGRLARAASECDKPRRDDSGSRPESDEKGANEPGTGPPKRRPQGGSSARSTSWPTLLILSRRRRCQPSNRPKRCSRSVARNGPSFK